MLRGRFDDRPVRHVLARRLDLAERSPAVRAEARAAEERRAALAARHAPAAVQQSLDLGQTAVDADDRRRPFREQVVAEAAAAIHLDEEPAQVGDGVGARLEQCAPFPAKKARVGSARLQAVCGDAVGCATPSEER
jgi:hypothetical protein